MSAFSFTAPFISEEQEEEERATFTEQEKHDLRDDLYGGGAEDEPPVTEQMVTNGLALIRECLDQIPDDEKLAYVEAVERAPELVEQESPAVAFLKHDGFDAWAAAKRLTDYWKIRKMIFGSDRAFLPMTMDGAMHEDIEHLKKGIVMQLPPDKFGRKVFFLDRIRCVQAVAPKESILRCIYYVLQSLMEQEQCAKLVGIINYRGFDLYTHFDRIQTRRMLMIYNSMPISCRSAHGRTGSGQSVLGLVLPVIKHMVGKHLRHRFVVHAGSDKEVIQRMELYGLEEANVTSVLGGGFTRADFEAWLRDRHEFERRRDAQQNEER